MNRHPLDHGHEDHAESRAKPYTQLDRIKAREGMHPKVRMLARRRKGPAEPSRIKHFLRIERGYLA